MFLRLIDVTLSSVMIPSIYTVQICRLMRVCNFIIRNYAWAYEYCTIYDDFKHRPMKFIDFIKWYLLWKCVSESSDKSRSIHGQGRRQVPSYLRSSAGTILDIWSYSCFSYPYWLQTENGKGRYGITKHLIFIKYGSSRNNNYWMLYTTHGNRIAHSSQILLYNVNFSNHYVCLNRHRTKNYAP